MPARVSAIHATPIKSLRLESLDEAELTATGIPDDRRFLLTDPAGRVITQREIGALATLGARYDAADNRLVLTLPAGERVDGHPQRGSPFTTLLWGEPVVGSVVRGPWAEAISSVANKELQLVQVDEGPALGKDSVAVSVLGEESLAELRRRGELTETPEARRFRPTLLIRGGDPHAEDAWVGCRVRAGEAVLHVVRRDPRCSLTTRNPETGLRDLDTLRLIASYRPPDEDRQVYFGVYADVLAPGTVRVGDPVHPLTEDDS